MKMKKLFEKKLKFNEIDHIKSHQIIIKDIQNLIEIIVFF